MKNPFRRVRPPARGVTLTAANITDAASMATPSERARALLLLHLTDEQAFTYEHANYLQLTGSAGGRYCLHAEPRVYALGPKGDHVKSFCSFVPRWYTDEIYDTRRVPARYFVADGILPRDDEVLCHLLLLMYDEPKFLDIAPGDRLTGGFLAHRPRRRYALMR